MPAQVGASGKDFAEALFPGGGPFPGGSGAAPGGGPFPGGPFQTAQCAVEGALDGEELVGGLGVAGGPGVFRQGRDPAGQLGERRRQRGELGSDCHRPMMAYGGRVALGAGWAGPDRTGSDPTGRCQWPR